MKGRRIRCPADPFTDLLFNALLGFTFLFLVTIMFLNPVSKKGAVNLKAEYIISVTWPENQPDDLDLWVRDPHGETVSYLQKDVGWMHLDRDDRGDLSDTLSFNGKTIINPINQEVITLRGHITGEYVVNLYYYKSVTSTPVTATVKIEKVNPTLTLIFLDKVTLDKVYDEKTIIRFNIDDNGEVTSMNDIPMTLTPYLLEPEP